MRVIVDTSVWSLALRRPLPSTDPAAQRLAELITGGQSICLLGVILQELLQGVRSREQLEKLKKHLEAFPVIEPARETYVRAAELSSNCRRRGIQASTIDFLIAAAAIDHDCLLLTSDRDFQRIAQHAPLKLVD